MRVLHLNPCGACPGRMAQPGRLVCVQCDAAMSDTLAEIAALIDPDGSLARISDEPPDPAAGDACC